MKEYIKENYSIYTEAKMLKCNHCGGRMTKIQDSKTFTKYGLPILGRFKCLKCYGGK